MKKMHFYILLLSLFLSWTSLSQAEQEGSWTEHNAFESSYLAYYTYDDECLVSVNGHEGKAYFIAYDKAWRGRTLIQSFLVQEKEGGGMGRTEFYSVSPSGSDPVSDAQEIETYKYDIFDTKCRGKTQGLPDPVKDAFYKYYDLSR